MLGAKHGSNHDSIIINAQPHFMIGSSGHVKDDALTRWTAPEIFRGEPYTMASDVWGYAIVVHELFSDGSIPYSEFAPSQVKEFVAQGYRLDAPAKSPYVKS